MANTGITHVALTVSLNKQPLWTLEGNSYEDYEMIAGIVASIAEYLPQDQPREFFEDVISVTVDSTERGRYVINDLADLVEDLDISDIEPINLTTGDFSNIARIENRYGWLYNTPGDQHGYIDVFRTPNFIQGVIMGANACGMDFRDVYIGKPFTIDEHGNFTYYDIVGYPTENPPNMPTWVDLVKYGGKGYGEGYAEEYVGGSPEDSPWMRH